MGYMNIKFSELDHQVCDNTLLFSEREIQNYHKTILKSLLFRKTVNLEAKQC